MHWQIYSANLKKRFGNGSVQIKQLTPLLAHRSRTNVPTLLVIHATAGASARSSVDVLRGKRLSYHFIIARDGKDSSKSATADGSSPIIYQGVPITGHAFHVGSEVPTPAGVGINKGSVGISLANIQNKNSPEPYQPLQLAALDDVIRLVKGQAPSITHLTTHAVIQPWNRSDPQSIDGKALAAKHGLIWWQPTAAEIAAHKPKKP